MADGLDHASPRPVLPYPDFGGEPDVSSATTRGKAEPMDVTRSRHGRLIFAGDSPVFVEPGRSVNPIGRFALAGKLFAVFALITFVFVTVHIFVESPVPIFIASATAILAVAVLWWVRRELGRSGNGVQWR